MPYTGPLRVAIGRFANLVSLGLNSLLADDSEFQVVATQQDYPELLAALDGDSAPAVIVLDESLALAAVIEGLRNRRPSVGLVFVAHGASAQSRLLRARLTTRTGISCISTDIDSVDFRDAVLVAAEGHAPHVKRDVHRPTGLAHYHTLTPREQQVLSYLLRGCRPTEIAVELTITPHTVRTHVKRIYRKLGVRSREQLLRLESPSLAAGSARHLA